MNETIQLTCFFSHGFNISRLQKKLINSLVSKKTVVPRRWGNQNENLISNDLIRVKLPP